MTRLFGVIGHPITHSLSPAMHTAALKALRCDAVYSAFDVPPRFVRPILRAFTLAGVEGVNVTVPLKEVVIPALDRLDASAKAIGAVNTIVIRNRRLIGYNTDGVGFMRALHELGWRPRPMRALLLGAGGAAKAVAWELSRVPGMRLTIANRHQARAQHLLNWLKRHRPKTQANAVPWTRAGDVARQADLVVNATTVGMGRRDRPPVDPSTLRRGAVVYDLIYHHETALVRAARRRGCVAANGVSMLLYQGAESLRLWLHRAPPINVMRAALQQALKRGS